MKQIDLLREAVHKMGAQGISMRKRFLIVLLISLFGIVALLYLLLNLLGIVNPSDYAVERVLTQELDHTVRNIEESIDSLAAYAVAFSEEITAEIRRSGYDFEEFLNNQEALTELQEEAYDSVYTNMRLAECSGAFYFLDTTVNDTLPDTYYNGLYLKFAALSASVTVRSDIVMFRGNARIARHNDINLHTTWEFETKKDTFPEVEALLQSEESNPARNYVLTPVYKLPSAWERVRFLCTPINDDDGNVIGVCGFEISDLYFQHYNQTANTEHKQLLCALLTEHGDSLTGQISGNRKFYMPHLHGELSLEDQGRFSVISDGEHSFIGKTAVINICNEEHTVAVVMPEELFDSSINEGRIKSIGLLSFICILAIIASLYLSKYYVQPIIQAMEQIKKKQMLTSITRIPEIDDLFAFLAQKDKEYDEEITLHRQQNTTLQNEVDRLHDEKNTLKSQMEQVQTDNSRLAYLRKDEVDPDSYTMFIEHLHTLSVREKAVFDLYVEGKSAKEITEILGFTTNGLKYHNKNIYSKLGVSSRKELLKYVTIYKQERE